MSRSNVFFIDLALHSKFLWMNIGQNSDLKLSVLRNQLFQEANNFRENKGSNSMTCSD